MVPSQIPIVILCGGESLRFRTRSADFSKALAPIGDAPIICHIINRFRKIGCSQFIICVRDSDTEIGSFFKENPTFSHGVSVVKTGEDTPTGGRLKNIESLIKTDQFFLTYGDYLTDVCIESIYRQHLLKMPVATVMAARPRSAYGLMELTKYDQVQVFEEKPLLNHWVNGGLFVFSKEVFSFITKTSILETDVLSQLIKNNGLYAYRHAGFWQSMDTQKEHQILNEMWKSKNTPWIN